MQASVATVVEEVWSPSEIVDCAATKPDELTPVTAPFAVTAAKRYAFRTSLVVTPFECLHNLWNPDRTPLTSSELLEKCDMCPSIMTWDQLAEVERLPNTIPDRNKDGWFRFTSTFPTVTFEVNRSADQLLCFLAALDYSFPQLITPFCDGQATLALAVSVCRFARYHHRELSAYLPFLYFFYERDDKLATSFLTQMDTNLKNRLAQEEKSLRSFKPKTSKGWFSWGSSSSKKKDEPGMSLADQFSFMSEYAAELPPPFKELFVLTISKSEHMENWCTSAQHLAQTWRDREAAFRRAADALPVVAPPYETGSRVAVAFTGTDDGEELKRTSLMLHQFMQNVAIVTREATPSRIHAFSTSANVAASLVRSKRHHLEKLLQETQTLVENKAFLTGKAKPPKEAPAHDNATVFSTAVNTFTELQNRLRKCSLTLSQECDWIDSEVRQAQKQCCAVFSELLHAEVAAFDADRHFKTPPTSSEAEQAAAGAHPLLLCLGATKPTLASDAL